MGFWERRRHVKEAKDLLRVGAQVEDLHEALKVVAKHGMGVDNIAVDHATEKGILVVNAPYSNLNAVAEHIVMLLLALSKRTVQMDQLTRAGQFKERNTYKTIELKGATVGIIGMGKISRLVVKKLSGFEMNILATDPYVKQADVEGLGITMATPEELYAKSDFVIVHTSLFPSTFHLVGAEQFKAMKNTAFIINAARGSAIKQNELVEALKAGEIAGAGLDVYASEPLTSDEPLLAMDNVICTPHYAGFTTGAVVKTGIDVAESILSVKDGKTPKYLLK